jgi:hypothetical protein
MPARGRILLFVLAALLGTLLAWGVLRAAAGEFGPGGERTRDEAAPNQPAISFIDSPTASCSLPVSGTGDCYVSWNYIYVTAGTSQYIISSTISIDNRLRASYSGFFQNYLYVPASMNGQGFRVTCGVPGSGGKPDLGRSYSYIVRARETGGLKAANYGTVYCPADQVRTFLPFLKK